MLIGTSIIWRAKRVMNVCYNNDTNAQREYLVKEAACCRMNCRGVAETYNVIIDDDWALAKEEETDNNNDIGMMMILISEKY